MDHADKMLAMVESYHRSELTHSEFAASQGVSVATLRKWKKRYREEGPVELDTAPSFIEIDNGSISDAPTESDPDGRQPKIDVELPCGTRIRIY